MVILSEAVKEYCQRSEKVRVINPNILIEMRFQFVENFELFYRLNFMTQYKPSHKHFVVLQFIQYSLIFDSREDKLDFCKKFIQNLEFDTDGFFKDAGDVKENLLNLFRIEWDSLRKAMVGNTSTNDYDSLISAIRYMQCGLDVMQDNLKAIANKSKTSSRRVTGNSKPVEYSSIFIKKEVGIELKNILQKYGYTDKNGVWCTSNVAQNSLAIAYYVLREPGHGFELISNRNKQKPQLIALYKEFGLQVDGEVKTRYVTYRNLATEPTYGRLHDEYASIFEPLKKYKP